MSAPELYCTRELRRALVARREALNGLDYLEVSDDQLSLTVYFLGKAPTQPAEDELARHVVVRGGRRVRDIRVTAVHIERDPREDHDDRMIVQVDRPGDFSAYTLCLVNVDKQGRPTDQPLRGFDPRYACLEFTFKVGCPSELDCDTSQPCPPELPAEPEINYLAKDYASFRQLLLDRLALVMPQWRERHIPDLGVTLVELLAYAGDQLSYYQDAVATEAYLETARLRISVRRHARLVDYFLHEGCNARTWVGFEVSQDIELDLRNLYLLPRAERADEGGMVAHEDLSPAQRQIEPLFEPVLEAARSPTVWMRQAHNRILIYTWGDAQCCLPRGARSVTLIDPGAREHALKLAPCDVVIFVEERGAKTGSTADADLTRRHAVRITRATPGSDPLTGQLLLEIEWGAQDALPFPVCVSSIDAACEPVADVSVVRGNIVLADHGRRREETLGPVPGTTIDPDCTDPCGIRETRHRPRRLRTPLKFRDLTFREPPPRCGVAEERCSWNARSSAATSMLEQDPQRALPQVALLERSASADGATSAGPAWEARRDLLGSGPDDRHFVVEVDDERVAHLRFGDGECGRMPDAGVRFDAHYRTGNAMAGNIGAETLVRLVFRNALPSGVSIRTCNWLAARGGTEPQSVAEARLLAPHALRRNLRRAVIAADYAAIAQRDFEQRVQRAAATLVWTGSGYEVQVAIDELGRAQADPALLRDIERHLQRFRRIGHDLRVLPARRVALHIALHVCVKAGYLRAHVRAALLEALGSGVRADGERGFFHPDRMTFGEAVPVTALVAAAQKVVGVECVHVTKFERLYEGPNGELENGFLPLGPLEIARLDNEAGSPDDGRLTLKLEGGR